MILTIGHSNHSWPAFLELLRRFQVATLVDVRSHPHSKRFPHFCKRDLVSALEGTEISYHFFGRGLGGRPTGDAYYRPDGLLDCAGRAEAPDFLAAIERLLALARCATTALMCGEADPGDCHRRHLLAPALRERGVTVMHIRTDGSLENDTDLGNDPQQLSLFPR